MPALELPARQVLLADEGSLERSARLGLAEPDPTVRLNVLSLLAEQSRPFLAYLLASAVSDPIALVRNQAAKALQSLVRQYIGNPAAIAQYIAPAVNQAMRSYSFHQAGDVVKAAVMLGWRCADDTMELMDRPVSQLGGPVQAALKELPPAESAGFILSALRHKSLGHAARLYITRADWPTLGALGAYEHWLSLSPIRKAVGEIRAIRVVNEDPAGLAELPAAQQGGALRLVMASGVSQPAKDTLLGLALTAEAAAARAAIPFVVQREQIATELLLLGLHSRHAEVQTVAAARIIAGGADKHLTEHLLESLPGLAEPVRGVVSQHLAGDSFRRYWNNYRQLDKAAQTAAGKALVKLDSRVVDLLAGRLICRDPNQQFQAVQMIRQLNMVRRFEDALCDLARHGDRMIRSAAVHALGQLDNYQARATLAGCLHDKDARVQANAVEALAALGGNPSAVQDKIDSEFNRVRANAIKWLLECRHPRGDMALAAMLTDGRTPHRISALWVVKTLRYQPAEAILDRLALHDSDAKVRARSATILRDLRAAPAEVPV